jgi:hypothetical protein
MPLVKVDCHTVDCDYCGESLGDGDGMTYHVANMEEGEDTAGNAEWFVDDCEGEPGATADGPPTFICHNRDCQREHLRKHPGAHARLFGFWTPEDEEAAIACEGMQGGGPDDPPASA